MSPFKRRRAERDRLIVVSPLNLRAKDRERAVDVTIQETRRVSLSDFKTEVIVEYLREQGYAVDGVRVSPKVFERTVYIKGNEDESEGGIFITTAIADRAALLALCGQREAAIEMLLDEVRWQGAIRL